ncbi:MAG: TAT-variant-translocated molybdopterin oxidoreductase, partial [Acidobacteria bacterium]|nr:TAT-variant-translocated molybdopterin oxidoreductase [Acidobacteriota bacterium]
MKKQPPGRREEPLDLAAIRAQLHRARGRAYWRSLEELAETATFREFLHREFPSQASEWLDPVGRRAFLKLMGASLALAGVSACTRQPLEKVLPYVRQPEEIVPGKPLFFATAMTHAGAATGLLVESHEGRPTKIEGNPEHPSSLGATDVVSQASILELYDPDRSQTVNFLGDVSTWSAFLGALSVAFQVPQPKKGVGLRILSGSVTSPSLAGLIKRLLRQYPGARWHQYDPAGRDQARAASLLAFGQYAHAVYQFDQADVILSLDADFLCSLPGSLNYTRAFTRRRRVEGEDARVNRLYVVESTPSSTGAKADHRLAMRPGELLAFAQAVASSLGIQAPRSGEEVIQTPHLEWMRAVVRDLGNHRGACLVVPGEFQPPLVHVLAHAMNHALGNVGKTVRYTDPIEADPVDGLESMSELVRDMQAGRVELLVILGGNPVYDAPADLNFAEHLEKVPFRARLGLYYDETSELCHWHIPEAHYLESWGDARAFDGTVSVVQPLIAP